MKLNRFETLPIDSNVRGLTKNFVQINNKYGPFNIREIKKHCAI